MWSAFLAPRPSLLHTGAGSPIVPRAETRLSRGSKPIVIFKLCKLLRISWLDITSHYNFTGLRDHFLERKVCDYLMGTRVHVGLVVWMYQPNPPSKVM